MADEWKADVDSKTYFDWMGKISKAESPEEIEELARQIRDNYAMGDQRRVDLLHSAALVRGRLQMKAASG